MAVNQKRFQELINTYFPGAGDDLSTIYLAVDGAVFGAEAQKMPLDVVLGSVIHIEGDLLAYSAGEVDFEIVFGTAFQDADYKLDIVVYKIDSEGADSWETSLGIKNKTKTASGFTFQLFKSYSGTIYLDYFAITR